MCQLNFGTHMDIDKERESLYFQKNTNLTVARRNRYALFHGGNDRMDNRLSEEVGNPQCVFEVRSSRY